MGILEETYQLNDGNRIPRLAFGTWQMDDDTAESSVAKALAAGYRHIDTAVQYENERGVGRGISRSGVPRSEVFVTSKVPHDVKDHDGAAAAIDGSLERLGLDYLDLVLIHAPKPWPEVFAGSDRTYFEENLEVWRALEEAVSAGKARSIGVSNFEVADIENIWENGSIRPAVNQVRVHIGHVPTEVLAWCREHGVVVEAFSPNATGKLRGNPTIEGMAARYGVSVPQLAIRFDLQLGVVPLPKTTHEEYMRSNADVDFAISEGDMDTLLAVDEIQSL